MSRVKQGGDLGLALTIKCIPSSTLNGIIDAYADKKSAIGLYVTLSADYVVDKTADDAIPNGKIVGIQGNVTNDYDLTVELLSLVSQNTAIGYFKPTCIRNIPYADTLAFGDTVQVNGAAGKNVEDAGADTGTGFVLAKDNPATGFADVAF